MAARRAGPTRRGAHTRKLGPGVRTTGASAQASRLAGSRGAIAEVQRTRLLTAMAVVCRRIGPGRVTVQDIVKQAGVSRRTFYELYSDRDACLADALQEALRRAAELVVPAYDAETDWAEAVRAGLEAFLAFLDEDRTFGNLLILDAFAAGDEALRRRAEVVKTVARAIQRGRGDCRPPRRVSLVAAEGAVGAVLAVLHARLLVQPEKPVSPLAGEIAADVLSAGLGMVVPARPGPKPAVRRKRANGRDGGPLAPIGIRLTYRTLLVLRALARQQTDSDGMSNRQVAAAAGISDQGQASKLLARLSRHGLIVNTRNGRRRDGEPNAWKLTDRGASLERATRRAGE